MVKKLNNFFGLGLVLLVAVFFYSPVLTSNKTPTPSDTIIGLYHPFRDLYASTNPNGIPFKNFLITDPVRQTYVWKELSINTLSTGSLPLWNPYEMAGKPLLANFQSGALYPLNIIFLISPFWVSWSVFILLQTVLTAFFMYIYLSNLRVSRFASSIGALTFSFCSFSISWLEWGNIGHTALWLPLVLFSIDKAFENKKIIWLSLLCIALTFAFFAGHPQTFIYLFAISFAYLLFRWFQAGKNKKRITSVVLSFSAFLVLSLPQLIPTIRFLILSSRNIDQNFRFVEGWFLPYKHLVQIVAPDFFGNPTTLNYWGTWNYGELTIYIGVLPFVLSLYSLFKIRRETIFYWSVAFVCLLLILPDGISGIPFSLNVPFLATAQPTRLIFIITFCLSVLAAFGYENISLTKKITPRLFSPFAVVGVIFIFLWITIIVQVPNFFPTNEAVVTAKRNLFLPTIFFAISFCYITFSILFRAKNLKIILFILGFMIITFDLLRFGQKFTPFTMPAYLFPQSKILDYLKNQKGQFRVASLDRRIMPPNFFTHYKIQTIEGYDPLYLKNYAEYIVAMERGKPDITPPFGFNRMITPHNFNSKLFNLLNVRYLLSFDELKSDRLTKVMEEGETKLYLNKDVFERVFFVKNVIAAKNTIKTLFSINLKDTAVIPKNVSTNSQNFGVGNATVRSYEENSIEIATENDTEGFLVLTDTYYPTWQVFIDGEKNRIIPADHAFRGVFVPAGKHTILFKNYLF